MSFSVKDKVILISGGAGGIGRATAQSLLAGGAVVVLADNDDAACASGAAELGCEGLPLDVTSESAWGDVVATVVAKHGRLDVLVNGAGVEGVMGLHDPERTSYEDWQRVHRINLDGTFLGCKAALATIARSGGGSIVNVSSVASMVGTPFAVPYGSTKAAIRQLTMSIAVYCGERRNNIRCNSVHPGPVQTPMLERTIRGISDANGIGVDEFRSEYSGMVPQGEFQQPEDVAGAIHYLVSDAARRVTGIELVVDGGLSVRL